MTTSLAAQAREDVLAYVRRQLVGPSGDDTEVIADPPNRRYLMGVLFPRDVDFEGYVDQQGEQLRTDPAPRTGAEEDQFADDPVASSNDFLPASQGLSFFTEAAAVEVTAFGARYETVDAGTTTTTAASSSPSGRRRVWRRRPLESAPQRITNETPASLSVLEGAAELHVRWRSFGSGSLVTVSLVNARHASVEKDRAWDDMILQAGLTVSACDGGEFLEYPSARLVSTDPEELELRVQYRHARTFAVGHGCAADWDEDPDDRVTSVSSQVMPRQEVPKVSAGGDRRTSLRLQWLADAGTSRAEVVEGLRGFVEDYGAWVRQQSEALSTLPAWGGEAGDRIVARLEHAMARMHAGVDVLASEEDPRPLTAFRLANRAMAVQMRRSAADLGGSRRRRRDPIPDEIQVGDYSWRPFQLAFALLALPGLVDPGHDDRAAVDLLWFPTGGGKTEAYLLLAAFEILHRRLLDPVRGGGTTVLSRYTLSLLTTQQFQRAAATVCALEDLRSRDKGSLGDEPVSIGLWVGQATTPNKYQQALEAFQSLRDDPEPDDRFLLERCPWCGTEILPRILSQDDGDYGIAATTASFDFFCPREDCDFHGGLPVRVVDDDLYDRPPTFLLGTVDKFAGLAWEERAGCFFGDGGRRRRPSLIIQDELHLLSGPLGTTMGVYEAAIQLLCEENSRPAKVVASTATIRRAPEQVLGLFGREVELFPPSGLDSTDSYFAKVDATVPGRLYVGLMAQGHTADTATVHTGAALLQAPHSLALPDTVADGYWTMVAYHSSLRELGRTVTIARDDIPARLHALASSEGARTVEVDELTANVDRAQQPRLLERLNLSHGEPDAIDFLASTNMLSVGVDVPRLGLMLINGQPKATSEYIQASSRVGRGDTPGLVFSMFRSTRPRDRSHYEGFKAYHAALYRHVEPTSVTPFSPPSRQRSLHAALVILVRHAVGLNRDHEAGRIGDHRAVVSEFLERLVTVVERVEPREASGARRNLEAFLAGWLADAKEADRQGKNLHYKSHGKGQMNLLRDFFQRGAGRDTLRSMRNVDRSCIVTVFRRGRD